MHRATGRPFVLGAVAYDPKAVTIWEGFREWFAVQGFALDYVLYSIPACAGCSSSKD